MPTMQHSEFAWAGSFESADQETTVPQAYNNGFGMDREQVGWPQQQLAPSLQQHMMTNDTKPGPNEYYPASADRYVSQYAYTEGMPITFPFATASPRASAYYQYPHASPTPASVLSQGVYNPYAAIPWAASQPSLSHPDISEPLLLSQPLPLALPRIVEGAQALEEWRLAHTTPISLHQSFDEDEDSPVGAGSSRTSMDTPEIKRRVVSSSAAPYTTDRKPRGRSLIIKPRKSVPTKTSRRQNVACDGCRAR